MTNEELLKALEERFNTLESRLVKIENRLDGIDTKLDAIEENTEITRDTLNSVVEWIDFYFREEKPFPIDTAI